ncbi:Uncharacterized protein conserved in bacteria [Legionella lansingensis]|uniref:Heparin-sulfate lyase n=1 Tax=Legionella lansingensis TaxID=45067 RepID=A0A0W0VW14_9GAMM|nr:heparinase II/III family protein [Legionella lansingensis]KTD24332.1 Heparin-sulfate lyase precursor [Legionella lansingensis]SNV51765.1 Uncharacterized protein conserved in bacteria [Legionella lansingensis]
MKQEPLVNKMIGRIQQIIIESGYRGVFERIVLRIEREWNQLLFLTKSTCKSTYQNNNRCYVLEHRINPEDLILLEQANKIPSEVIAHYLDHRFDLLGSGWVNVFYGMNCRGLDQYHFKMGQNVNPDINGYWLKGRINRANLSKAQQIWQYVDEDYQPIDWQLDFKSGYRWSERTLSKKIQFGHKLGVDVKVPWELARMQHLPQMALAVWDSELDEGIKHQIQKEYQNQVLDFMATNPPGFGVNWVCPMDIAIRAVNWLLAKDLFLASQIRFPEYFETLMAKSIYEHGKYIIANLEWYPQRSNHYLANITGLAFIASYLPSDEEVDTWLAFAVQELNIEVERQFYKDGGNFEGSTAYHRLSAEMVYYATALIMGLPKERLEKLKSYDHKLFKNRWGKPRLQGAPRSFYSIPNRAKHSPFPEEYFQCMERMVEFIIDITKPNGHIPQIGDNDSGRFLKLAPKYQKMSVKQARENYANLDGYKHLHDDANYFMEDHLDCSHLIAGAFGVFGKANYYNWLGGKERALCHPDSIILRILSQKELLISQDNEECTNNALKFFEIGTEDILNESLLKVESLAADHVHKTQFTIAEGDLLTDLNGYAYPHFGLFILRSSRLYMAIRCWVSMDIMHSSHIHQDQLSVELSIDGQDLVRDPGTYLYTSLPFERYNYRSSNSHFSPFANSDDPSICLKNVFRTVRPERVSISYFGRRGFVAHTQEIKDNSQLIVYLESNSVIIYQVNHAEQHSKFIKKQLPFSPGYGIKLRHGGSSTDEQLQFRNSATS